MLAENVTSNFSYSYINIVTSYSYGYNFQKITRYSYKLLKFVTCYSNDVTCNALLPDTATYRRILANIPYSLHIISFNLQHQGCVEEFYWLQKCVDCEK
jgi:hypothetical protein